MPACVLTCTCLRLRLMVSDMASGQSTACNCPATAGDAALYTAGVVCALLDSGLAAPLRLWVPAQDAELAGEPQSSGPTPQGTPSKQQ